MRQLENEATTLGVKLDSRSIEQELQQTRNGLAQLQSGLLQLEGSSALDRIADLEKQRVIAQTEAERITSQIDLLSHAAQNAKSAADTTKRVSWESVDDCLATLSPLLSELFLRLSRMSIIRKCDTTCGAMSRDFPALRLVRASTPASCLVVDRDVC
jgi:hypothetical protein